MRILLVHPGPDFSVHDVHAGWYEAFQELGADVASYNLNDRFVFYSRCLLPKFEDGRPVVDEAGLPIVTSALDEAGVYTLAMDGLYSACMKMWPDVVMFVSAFFTTAGLFQLLRMRNMKTVILHTESPYQDDEQLMRGQMVDVNLLNDPVNLKKFEALEGEAAYMPHAYRSSLHHPRTGPPDPSIAADLGFIGTAFKSRVEFFTSMDLEGLDVLLGGSDWAQQLPEGHPLRKYLAHNEDTCVGNDETTRVYQNVTMGLNLYRQEGESTHENDQAIAMGPREVEMAACGLPFLRDRRPEGDSVLHMLPTFDGPEDASEKLRWWLAHPLERSRAANLAREAIADRTFVNNAKRLLKVLDR